jgi:hypothetical protein
MKNDKKDLYEGMGCGCMILAAGIALSLPTIFASLEIIVKAIWK